MLCVVLRCCLTVHESSGWAADRLARAAMPVGSFEKGSNGMVGDGLQHMEWIAPGIARSLEAVGRLPV